jgi:hypothetical protein
MVPSHQQGTGHQWKEGSMMASIPDIPHQAMWNVP